MNVFFCDWDPNQAARSLANRHVVKMTLETAQILSTTARLQGREHESLYRPTHKKHPVVRGCVSNPVYAGWVLLHGRALAEEYTRRFGKVHKSARVIDLAGELVELQEGRLESVPLAMPDVFKGDDPVLSYRLYLAAKYRGWVEKSISTGKKSKMPVWKNSSPPDWLGDFSGGKNSVIGHEAM